MYPSSKLPVFILFISLLFASCQSPQATEEEGQQGIKSLSNIEHEMNQTIAKEAKNHVLQNKHVTKAYAVNTFDSLVVAFELRPFSRLRTHKISDEFKKEFNDRYPIYDAIVTTDKKIIWELKKTEEKLKDQNTDINDIQLEIKRIIKLAKDNA